MATCDLVTIKLQYFFPEKDHSLPASLLIGNEVTSRHVAVLRLSNHERCWILSSS
jgi:hypothetical protein